jgi:acyl-CoA synthetase (AMP-forming)/AMP-acid ligase II
MFHLSRVLYRAAELYAGRHAVSDGPATLTYGELGARVGGLVAALRERVGPGDRVLLLDRNSLRSLEVHYACAALEAILVPLNTRLAAREIARIHAETEPVLALASDAFAALLPAGIEAIVWPDTDPPGADNPYERLASQSAPLPLSERPASDIAQIFYTSGTSGVPKGVCLTHGNLVAGAYDGIVVLALNREDVWLHTAPMFHLVDAFAIWSMSMVGGVHAIAHFRPETFADTIAALGVTKTSMPPTLIAMATDHIAPGDPRVRSLELVSYGGSPMTEAVHTRATAALGVDMVQAYGITEGSGIVTHQLPGDYRRDGTAAERRRLRSVGQAAPGVALRLAGDAGEPVAADGIGEIQIAGPHVMAGYWRQPEATRAALPDGWYRTGDLGQRDADGHLFIVGRKKDMIITGGENVYPTEVENVLAAHPAVAEVAVFGIPSERWGEEVRAAVVLREGSAAEEAELLAFCRERIGGYKVPKAIDFRVESLPMTGPGKVAKQLLRAEYAAR